MMLGLLKVLAVSVTLLWMASLSVAWTVDMLSPGHRLVRRFGRVHRELWLFAPPGQLITLTDDWHRQDFVGVFFMTTNVFVWWWYRNWPDENLWKRRRRKLAEKVSEVAGRLTVVPAS